MAKQTQQKGNTIEVPVFFCPHCGEILPDDLVDYIVSSRCSARVSEYWSDEENRLRQAARAKAKELFRLGVKARQEQAAKRREERERRLAEEGKPARKQMDITEGERERRKKLGELMHEARRRKTQERRGDATGDAKEAGRHHIDSKQRNFLRGIYERNKGVFSTAPSGVALLIAKKALNAIYFDTAEELVSIFMQKKTFANKKWFVRGYEMEDGTTLYSFHMETSAEHERNRLFAVIAHVDVSGMKNPSLQ